MKYDISNLKQNQNIMRQDIVKLEKKVDRNHEDINKRLDENLYEISEKFQETSERLNRKNKRKVAIF